KNPGLDDKAKFDSNDFTMTVGWNYNNLDRGFFPTSGLRSSLDTKVTIPGSNNQFYKVTWNSAGYYPLDDDRSWVLAGRTRLGYGG
ncbi:BamA/TamA family outer membrane protein, partial [Xenorhabdus bovienii]